MLLFSLELALCSFATQHTSLGCQIQIPTHTRTHTDKINAHLFVFGWEIRRRIETRRVPRINTCGTFTTTLSHCQIYCIHVDVVDTKHATDETDGITTAGRRRRWRPTKTQHTTGPGVNETTTKQNNATDGESTTRRDGVVVPISFSNS